MQQPPRSILITGASSGIGRALAGRYATAGVRLVLVGRDAARLDAVAEGCRAAGADVAALRADVRFGDTLRPLIAAQNELCPFDLVIPAAGITAGLAVDGRQESQAARQAVFATNLDGAIDTVTPLIAGMCARGHGQIAFIGSMAAYRGLPYCPSYCASKAAIHVYAQALRAGLRPHGVHVSLVVPGIVATGMNRDLVAPRFARMTDTAAARIIRDGLAAGRDVIGFPRHLHHGARLLGLLPGRWSDAILRRVPVTIPEPVEPG